MKNYMNVKHPDVAVIIPSRIGSTRLEKKPLQKIGEQTMIEHVVRNVLNTGVHNIYVATDSDEIAELVTKCGANYIITDSKIASGTDRAYVAFKNLKNSAGIKYVVNVQGDMPFIKPVVILNVINSLKNSKYDIMTPVTKVDYAVAKSDSNVKVVVDVADKALYFSRNMIPYGSDEFLYHVGIYAFSVDALEKFVKLPKSTLEIAEKLEQLRALQNGMNIGVCYADEVPISVDTIDDLKKATEYYYSFVK